MGGLYVRQELIGLRETNNCTGGGAGCTVQFVCCPSQQQSVEGIGEDLAAVQGGSGGCLRGCRGRRRCEGETSLELMVIFGTDAV